MNKNVTRNKINISSIPLPKRFKNLGRSIPRSQKVRKNSPSPGTKISQKETHPLNIYNEAITNISSIKDNLLKTTKKSLTNFSTLSNFLTNHNEPCNSNSNLDDMNHLNDSTHLNDSFGSPRTGRSTNSLIQTKNKEENQWNEISSENILYQNESNSKINQSELNLGDSKIPNSDLRLKFLFNVLDLNQLFHLFNSSNLTFNDILILSREDLIEMNIQLAARNRIIKFADAYKSYGKNFTIEELKEFFGKFKNFCFNQQNLIENKINQNYKSNSNNSENILKFKNTCKGEEDIMNIYEPLSTANFNQENNINNISPQNKQNTNQVIPKRNPNNKMTDFYLKNIANDTLEIKPNLSFYDESTTLADYICNSNKFNSKIFNKKKNQERQLKIEDGIIGEKSMDNNIQEIKRKSFRINNIENNFFKNSVLQEQRSDSEEKAIQTAKIDDDEFYVSKMQSHKHFFSEKDNNILNLIKNRNDYDEVLDKSKENQKDDKERNSQNHKEISKAISIKVNENDVIYNSSVQESCENLKDSETTSKKNSPEGRKPNLNPNSNSNSTIINKKIGQIYKNYKEISDEIGRYMINFKELKEKSENRTNRLKCIINKSIKSRKNTNSNSCSKPHRDCNSIIYKNIQKRNHKRRTADSNENLEVQISQDDLEVEEERNLNEEINKLSVKNLNSNSNCEIDEQTAGQKLNSIRSLSEINSPLQNAIESDEKFFNNNDIELSSEDTDILSKVNYILFNQLGNGKTLPFT